MLNSIPLKEIELLLDYNWKDEESDFYMNYDEDGVENHIFTVMQKIDEWVTKMKEESK